MMSTEFFSQVWVGIIKELSVYKKNPMMFLAKGCSVFLFTVLTVIFGNTKKDLASSMTTNAIFQLELFITPASAVLYKLSTEREENFKEYLMINGMTKAAYQAKTITSNYLEVLFFAIVQSCGLYLTYMNYFDSSLALLQIFIILFLAGISTINLALFLSTIFNPKNASGIGSMVILLFGLLYFPGIMFGSLPFYILASFSPSAALPLSINSLLPTEQTKIKWDGYNGWLGSVILSISCLIYLSLYLYMERDKDTDSHGVRSKKLVKGNRPDIVYLEEKTIDSLIEDVEQPLKAAHTSALYYEIPHNFQNLVTTIQAAKLKKVYDESVALQDISFSIYEKEVFCILGHNGAGKTTLINILTGLISTTEGEFYYHGERVSSNIDKIRGCIGFCAQKDFLLMFNTVYENLSFFAEIKKVPADQMQSEIERVMDKMGLTTFRDMPAIKLSGGFRRKLNIAIALLNDPMIIIMDEPTSGMDPISRRALWKIIKDLKNDMKTVIITTQFLDEAEVLADRIAIMSRGTIHALGSSDFIKKKFGTGYTLIIQNMSKDTKISSRATELIRKVQRIIPTAANQINTSSDTIHFTLSFKEQEKFSHLFLELEEIRDIQTSLQMVSLEEAYVGIELSVDKDLKNKSNPSNSPSKTTLTDVPEAFLTGYTPTFMQQVESIFLLKQYNSQNNKRFLFFASFPLVFMIGGIAIVNHISDKKLAVEVMVLMLITGNSFLIDVFSLPPARERLSKISHTLRAMGLNPYAYWIATLITDFILKCFMTLILAACIFIFGVEYLEDSIFSFIILYLAFSFNLITLGYTVSQSFNSISSIMGAGPTIVILGFSMPLILNNILSNAIHTHILWALYLVSFVFFGPAAILQMGINTFIPEAFEDPLYISDAPFKQLWMYVGLATVIGIFQFMRVLYKESTAFELHEKRIFNEVATSSYTPVDESTVNAEKERLTKETNHDLIKAFEIQKTYPNGYKALHDLSFGVEEGQTFCLLGPNGAGKTTGFEIITARIPKTSGIVQIEGKDFSSDLSQTFARTGICSQSNTLWDSLTPRQHLTVYCRLKGIDEQHSQEIISILLKSLQLTEYADRSAEKLSGGNKRKLCAAISLIGAPKLLFLDEPSTGMDPVARNHLWAFVKNLMKVKKGAAVLTTHYMQEAELVGDKLGILVNGKFATIGSLSDLKNRFGEYSIIIQKIAGGMPIPLIDSIIQSIMPEARMEHNPSEKGLVFKVPANKMKFSQTFETLQIAKSQEKIMDFSIYTTTLEQIFIKMAKHQKGMSNH